MHVTIKFWRNLLSTPFYQPTNKFLTFEVSRSWVTPLPAIVHRPFTSESWDWIIYFFRKKRFIRGCYNSYFLTKVILRINILIVDENGCTIPNCVIPTTHRFGGVFPRPEPRKHHIQSSRFIKSKDFLSKHICFSCNDKVYQSIRSYQSLILMQIIPSVTIASYYATTWTEPRWNGITL